ncbi:MAG: hypothetical protein LBN07_00235 [Christensenellaceae bacterium]|jgi:hypothetical protein|nr:hypothetical protein [Christensenellaceae bacterium]
MKKQKEERPLKPIVLDAYKNTILTMVAVVLILAILIPFVVFSLNRLNKDIALEGEAAREAYQSILEDYSTQKYQSAKIEYSNLGATWHREQFNFAGGQLTSRIVFENATFEDTEGFAEQYKTVYRKITESDQQTIIDSGIDLSQGFAHYLLTTTDCIKEEYLLSGASIYQLQSSDVDTTNALGISFSTLGGILALKTGSSEIVSLAGEIDYNLFGLGYRYVTANFTDQGDNVITFEGNAITLTLSGGDVYNFSFRSR